MPPAYIKPGVTVDEILTPSFSPLIGEPTSICLIGPSQGYESHTEVTTLVDNHPYVLRAKNATVDSISVYDASNPNLSAFSASGGTGYEVDASDGDGYVRINRSMQTAIEDAEEVVVYYENQPASTPSLANSHSDVMTLSGIDHVPLTTATVDLDETTIRVQQQGVVDPTEYNLTGAGTGTVRITRQSGATVLRRFQNVWIDYIDSVGVQQYDLRVQLNWATTDQQVNLPANSTAHVVKNAPGATGSAFTYTKGTTPNASSDIVDADYGVYGTNATAAIGRSVGSTTMGGTNNRLQVRITYDATPDSYWLPTRVFSVSDAEDKFGPALNSDGSINSPLSFGALIAFQNGATNLALQALFSLTNGIKGIPTGATSDWENSLASLQNVEDVNVIVPLVSSGGLSTSDSTVSSIFGEVRKHITYMAAYDHFITAILGEDSTTGGYGSRDILRTHATSLGANVGTSTSGNEGEQIALVTPASFSYANPVSGSNTSVGGQFAACAIAGMMAARPVQTTLTRKTLVGINGVNEVRTEREKNEDAEAGLLVIEARNNAIRVRHAVTTANASDNASTAQRELNVVRAKHFTMESVRNVLDTQVVGQIPADNNAAFSVQLVVTGVLDKLQSTGVIVSYANVQARRLNDDPSKIEVRFSYTPSFPLNYIAVKFSIDTSTGDIIADVATQGV